MFNENTSNTPSLSNEQKDKYKELWNGLSEDSRKLLISSAHFSENTGGKREAVIAVSGLQPEEFNNSESELLGLGLMEIGYAPGVPVREGLDVSDRRRLPATVKQYILQEIVKVK